MTLEKHSGFPPRAYCRFPGVRQREAIALVKQRGAYRGRKRVLSAGDVTAVRSRVAAGEQKAQIARDLGISRETLYQYLRMPE